jgi:CHAT domain-containing protein/tetratricopeptide (TPR) repeat protein
MSVEFTIPYIDEELGHSVLFEEYKGDFARARQAAEASLMKARKSDVQTELADALLARGIVHVLQGEPKAAVACFDECERSVPSDPARRLRAGTYSNLAVHLNFNTFPDGCGARSTEIDVLWDGVAYAKQHSTRREALRGQICHPAVELESKLVGELLVAFRVAKSFVDHERNTTGEMGAALLDQAALSIPRAFSRHVEDFGASPRLQAAADLMAASLCWWGHDAKGAQEYLKNAQEGYQRASDLAGEAVCEMSRADWLVAPNSSPNVWNFLIKEGLDSSNLGWALESVEFAGGPAQLAALKEARAIYAHAALLFRDASANRGLAALQLREGYLSALSGDYTVAAKCAIAAAEAFDLVGDVLGFWVARAHLVLSRVGIRPFPEDAETAAAIGAWGREHGSFSYALGLGILCCRAGRYWLINKGDYERALACWRLAEALFRALGATCSTALSLVDQATTYRVIGEPYTAAAAFERARDLYAKVSASVPGLPVTVRWRAAKLETEIYQIYEKHRNADGMAKSLASLEQAAMRSVDMRDCDPNAPSDETQIDVVINAVITAQLETGRVLLSSFRGVQACDSGDAVEAERQFQLALVAARQAQPDLRDILEAGVFGAKRDYPQAIAAFRRHSARTGLRRTLSKLMEMFGEQGKAVVSQQVRSALKQEAGFFTRVQDYASAKQCFDELERTAGQDWWQDEQSPWEVVLDYAETYEGLGRWKKALESYDQAIELLEARRATLNRDELKTALVSDRSAQYLYFGAARTALQLERRAELGGDWAVANVHATQALGYTERGRARALLDLMEGSALLAGATPIKSRALADWRQLTAQLITWRGLVAGERAAHKPDLDRLADMERRIEADEVELRRVVETITAGELEIATPATPLGTRSGRQRAVAARLDSYQFINPRAKTMTLAEISALLPMDAALLEYYFLGKDLLVWVITRAGIQMSYSAEVDSKALERQIWEFHRACEARDPIDQASNELANLLLVPFNDVIQTHSHLLIVPYGAMHVLPFHVLPWHGKPLVSTHRLSYLPSASSLRFLGIIGKAVSCGRLLAVGNPVRMACRPPLGGVLEPQEPLPATAAEAAFVAGIFPQGKALVGDKATKPTVTANLQDYSILHFATHGHLSKDAPMLSSLLLADGEALSVYELMGLRLNADLVVLSACETGRGHATGGDDVLGLTRGLLAAGARAAVVSLWPVNDVSTALLMGEFYRRVRAGDPPAKALQVAQNYLRNLRGKAIDGALDLLKVGLNKVAAAERRSSGKHLAALEGGLRHAINQHGAWTGTRDYAHPFYWAPFILVG